MALGIGVLVGCFNFLLILALRIPPIIATLSSSFLIQSIAIAYGRGLRIKPPPLLADFTTARSRACRCSPSCAHPAHHCACRGPAPDRLRPLGGRHRPEPPRRALAGVDVARARFATYVMSAVFAACAAICLPASPAAPLSAWARSTC